MKFNHTTRRVLSDPLYGTQPIAGIRAATAAASQAAKTAAATGGQYGAEAQGIGGMLVPQLQQDVANAPGLGTGTTNAMLQQGLGAAGGAASGIVGQEGLRAARSRNVGGSAGVLDEAAREKMRTSAGVGLDVATKNAMVQQQQRASALKQLEGIYGTDVGAGLKAQSLVPEDIDAWAKANQTGWMQNTAMMINAIGGGAANAAAAKSAMG
jgi:hypothetical protein